MVTPTTTIPGTTPSTILVVDDHDAVRYTRAKVMRRAGYEVLEAASGLAALEMIRLHRPRLVILDIHLPDMNGFEVCARIKGDPGTALIPVLHVSATKVTAPDQVRGLDGGADGYLVEPVAPDVMVATVHALLRMKDAEEQARESRRVLDTLVKNLPGAAYQSVALGGRLTFVSERARTLTGLSQEELLSRPLGWWDMLPPEDAASLAEKVARAHQSLEPVEFTYRILGADGVVRWIWDRASPLLEQGRALLWEGFATDISELKRVQAERDALLESEHAARAQAERAGRLKDDFLATLSHELRTPLNSILGWAQILRRQPRAEESLTQGLTVIERNARLQAQLIGDLLDMNRIMSGKMRLDVQQVDLSLIIAAALESIGPAAAAKGVTLVREVAPIIEPIQGDYGRLQQVMWNLLSNAVKFTPRGGVVKVTLSPRDTYVEVSVIDSGKGIKPEFLPHVFERFRQADSSTGREHGGLGLGLAIVKQLVELHGGVAHAASPGLGHGSTFDIRLPRTPRLNLAPSPSRDDHADTFVRESAHPGYRGDDVLQGTRVLVLDDEPDAREMVVRLLTDCGAEVVAVGSAHAALDVLATSTFDVILSDIGLPSVDGYAFIKLAHERGISTPAAALTAFARPDDRARALKAGYVTHLTKPIEPNELVAAVVALSGKSMGRVD